MIVSGRGQGVSFRIGTKRHTKKLNLTGWVRNNSDGTVEIIAEGEQDALFISVETRKAYRLTEKQRRRFEAYLVKE